MVNIMYELNNKQKSWMVENGYDPEVDDFDEAIHWACEVIYYSTAYEVFDEYGYDPIEAYKEFCEAYSITPGTDDWEYCGACQAASYIWEMKLREELETEE